MTVTRESIAMLLATLAAVSACPADDDDGMPEGASTTAPTTGATSTETSTGPGETDTTGDVDGSSSSSSTGGACADAPATDSPCDDLEERLIECGWDADDAYDESIYCADDTYYTPEQGDYYACLSAIPCGEFPIKDPDGLCDCHDQFGGTD